MTNVAPDSAIVLKHHAGIALDDVQAKLKASEWWERFPVEGTRVVSWNVAMGPGQIVTLAVPPQLLGQVNLELERSCLGRVCHRVLPLVRLRAGARAHPGTRSTRWPVMVLADKIRTLHVPDLPTDTWSNARRIDQEVVVSGMTGHPATREVVERGAPLGAYEQTMVVLKKLEALVSAAGGHRHNLITTVVYLTDIADKDEVCRARRDFFDGAYPCVTLVAVSALAFPDLCVEIDAWARLDVDLRQSQPLSQES
jgi:2-iminobutanoate/2-iminopropanoate deaminase